MRNNKLLLDTVSIQGFRGFNDEFQIKLDAPINLLFGKNGGGKTSTLESIEWGLFGKTSDIVFKRTDNDHINALVKDVNVTLNFKCNEKEIEVKRTKKRNKSATNLTINGSETDDKDYRMFQILGLTFSDFIRAVFLHQESLKSLTDEDAERDRAIDRLFGLEMLSNIIEALPISDIRSKEKDMIGKLEVLKSQIRGSIKEARHNEEDHTSKCRQNGIEESQIQFLHAKNIFLELTNSINKLSTEAGLEKLPDLLPKSAEQLEDYTTNAETKIKKIRVQFIPKEIDKINGTISVLTRLRSDYVVLVSRENSKRAELTELIKKLGTQSSLNGELSKVDKDVKKLKDRKLLLDAKYEVVKTSAEYLKEGKITSCPICDREFSKTNSQQNILGKLKKELENHENEEINEIEKTIEELERQQKDIKKQSRQIEAKHEELDDAKKEIREFVSGKISKELLQTLKVTDDIGKTLETKINVLKGRVDTFEKSFSEKNKDLEILEGKMQKVKLICAVLKDRERIDKIAEIEQSKEFDKMEKIIQRLGSLKVELEAILQHVSEFQVNQAENILKESAPLINEYYKKLCNHPFYTDIIIEHEAEKRGAKMCNKYTIKCFNPNHKEETVAQQNLSTAQINSVALSIYLALAKLGVTKNNIGFLLMDDPAQNLDTEHMEALCNLLQDVAKEKQIIIATHDLEFQKMLETTFDSKDIKKYNYRQWDQNKPVIEEIE